MAARKTGSSTFKAPQQTTGESPQWVVFVHWLVERLTYWLTAALTMIMIVFMIYQATFVFVCTLNLILSTGLRFVRPCCH